MDEKSTHLKKCASLNNLIQNNQSATMNVAPSQNSPTRDHLTLSLLTPRTRRFSCSSNGNGPQPRLAPRVSQLRQEECADSQNVREVNHEREIHTALSISQSCEDLTIVMNDHWSFKSNDEFSNPLHVSLPNNNSCSSPSPTSRQNVMRLCSGMSPSPTRRSFATRRSMSPIAMRPSPLGSVKRKFDMVDDGNSCSSSSQPYKKFFTESYSRGSSPIMSPLPICPSPESSNSETFSGRITPKMFVTKAFSSNFSSMTSSPLSTNSFENDSPSPSGNNQACSSSSSSSSSSKDQERMEVASTMSADSGVDANSDVGCELLATNDVVQNDPILNNSETNSNIKDDMIIEEEVTPSNIPMTL